MKYLLFLILGFSLHLTAWGTPWSADRVSEVLKRIQKEGHVYENGTYPAMHMVNIQLNPSLFYTIDLRARLCFAGNPAGYSPVSCEAIKNGYPLLARLITWTDEP